MCRKPICQHPGLATSLPEGYAAVQWDIQRGIPQALREVGSSGSQFPTLGEPAPIWRANHSAAYPKGIPY